MLWTLFTTLVNRDIDPSNQEVKFSAKGGSLPAGRQAPSGPGPLQGPETLGPKGRSGDAAGLASGVYFYRLQTGDFIQTRKLCVMK